MNRFAMENIENRIPTFKDDKFDLPSRKQVRFDTPQTPFRTDVQTPRPPPTVRPLGNIENIYSAYNEQPHFRCEDIKRRDHFTRAYDNNPLKPNKDLELSVFDSPRPPPPKAEFNHNKFDIPPTGYFMNNARCSPVSERVTSRHISPIQISDFPPTPPFQNYSDSRYVKQSNDYTSTMPVQKYSEPIIRSPGTMGFFTRPNSKSDVFEKYPPRQKTFSKNQICKNNWNSERNPSPGYYRENTPQSNYEDENESDENFVCNCRANRKRNTSNNSEVRSKRNVSAKRCNGAEEKRNAMILREQSKLQSSTKNVEKDTVETVPNEPTVSDLYALVKMQIEQSRNLQNCINELANKVDNSNLDQNHPIRTNLKYLENEQLKIQQKINAKEFCEPTDMNMKKISVGVMTSFEMTVNTRKLNECNSKNIDEDVQTSINIFQKTNSNTQVDINEKFAQCINGIQTINFLEGIDRCKNFDDYERGNPIPMKANEGIPNNNGKFHTEVPNRISINDEEYQNIGNDNSQHQSGWTFYHDTMKHINNILLTPPDKFQDETQNNYKKKMPRADLHRMSFNMTDVNASSSKKVTFNMNNEQPMIKGNEFFKNSTETSLHLDKLAAKYFGDNSPLNYKNQYESNMLTKNPQIQYNDIENDMSLSKIQHMQKFNLLPGLRTNDKMETYPRVFEMNKNKGFRQFQNYPEPELPNKILDITALKQQPKLL